jgi:hypothetical protein
MELKAEWLNDNPNGKGGSHDIPSPVILSGTQVQTGQGKFCTIVVGEQTCEGQIMASVEVKESEMTALQKKLDIIAVDIGKLGMGCALLLFHFLVLRDILLQGVIRMDFDLFGGESDPKKGTSCVRDKSKPKITSGKDKGKYPKELNNVPWLKANCQG